MTIEAALARSVAKRLRPGVLVRRRKGGGFILQERPADMKFEVVSAPPGTIAIQLERLGHLQTLKQGSWMRICDYLLIADVGAASHAVFVELKKTQRDDDGPKDQLLRSAPILEYLRSICTVAGKISDDEPQVSRRSQVSIHYWIVSERYSKHMDRQHTRVRPLESEDRISWRYAVINTYVGSRIHFSRLAARATRTTTRGP